MEKYYFEGIAKGDRVWHCAWEWGTIIGFNPDPNVDFRIHVKFDKSSRCSFDYHGRFDATQRQTLFWNEVKINSPAKPKKKISKTIYYPLIGDTEKLLYKQIGEFSGYQFSGYQTVEEVKSVSSNYIVYNFEVEE